MIFVTVCVDVFGCIRWSGDRGGGDDGDNNDYVGHDHEGSSNVCNAYGDDGDEKDDGGEFNLGLFNYMIIIQNLISCTNVDPELCM